MFLLLSSPVLSFMVGIGFVPSPATETNFSLSQDVGFIRGPTVNMVTNHSAMIFCKTNGPTDVTVRYGLDTDVTDEVHNATLDTEHRVDLTELAIDSKYYYQVVANGTESEIYHFLTAPPDGGHFKMVLLGDNRPGQDVAPQQPQNYKDILEMIVEEEPHIVVMSGDFVYHVYDNHATNLNVWRIFSEATDALGHYAPIYACIGNHDTGNGWMHDWYVLQAFEQYDNGSTYFSFDYAGVHFTIIDTEVEGEEGEIRGEQWDWLVNDLANTEQPMKFVFGHRPLYPLSHLGSSMDENRTHRNELQELFETHNVTLFGCGHDHLYNRMTVNDLIHVISGGAGAPLYSTLWGGAYNHYVSIDVMKDMLNMTSIDIEGSPRDNYVYPYDGPIEIFLREIADGGQDRNGTFPLILFSEEPEQAYYSWNGEANSTTLTGLPSIAGENTLDVYAVGENGLWNHEEYTFTTILWPPPDSTTTTTTAPPIDPIMIVGIVGAVAVVVVVAVVFRYRSR
jgi:3',5'-cyclic AMP phosphodiesterase CpdA